MLLRTLGCRVRMPAVAFAALVFAALVGCDDERSSVPRLTLENSWPNDDGRFWSFALAGRQLMVDPPAGETPPWQIFASPEDVPTAPSMMEAIALLSEELEGEPITTEEGVYTLQFSGEVTTQSGVTAQNLVASLEAEPLPVRAAPSPGPGSGFLVQLAVARPDLRERLRAQRGAFTSAELSDFLPLILHGDAWEKTEEWIGTYGDFDEDLAWKFLEADLTTGREFTFQLVKGLADDVFLHARVARRLTLETESRAYEKAVEVVYLVDFGILADVDSNGATLGFSRAFSIGSIIYAPDAGPVYSTERILYFVGSAGPSGPWGDLSLHLRAAGVVEP